MLYSAAAKDGTTIAPLRRGILLAKLIYPTGMRFEIDKFQWLAASTPRPQCLARRRRSPERYAEAFAPEQK